MGQSQDCVNLFAGESLVSLNLFAGESCRDSPVKRLRETKDSPAKRLTQSWDWPAKNHVNPYTTNTFRNTPPANQEFVRKSQVELSTCHTISHLKGLTWESCPSRLRHFVAPCLEVCNNQPGNEQLLVTLYHSEKIDMSILSFHVTLFCPLMFRNLGNKFFATSEQCKDEQVSP